MMVEIFKTNVYAKSTAQKLIKVLKEHFPHFKINFDLQDCDRILRVEGYQLEIQKIKSIVNEKGFICEVIL